VSKKLKLVAGVASFGLISSIALSLPANAASAPKGEPWKIATSVAGGGGA